MGKGEIARYEQFLLFPQCFQKLSVVDIAGLVQEHAIFTYRDFSGAAFFYLSSLIKHIHDPNLDSLFLLVYFIILNIPHSLIIIITA